MLRRRCLYPRRLGGLALLLILGAAQSGCERRIEEPLGSRPLDPTSIATAPAEAQGGPPPKGRCIKATPPLPERVAPKGPDPRCPKDDEAQPPKLRTGKVTLVVNGTDGGAGAAPREIPIEVEIAEKDHDRQRGLMFRTQMSDAHGMIFVFDEKTDHSFWMHNTCIPLDMLFIDQDGLIVGIQENTPTLNDDTYSVGCLSKYVLEVNAGWTRARGVKAGQWVKIEL